MEVNKFIKFEKVEFKICSVEHNEKYVLKKCLIQRCIIIYLKIIFKLNQTVGQKLPRAFFLIFIEKKPIELILNLEHLN